MTSQKDGTNLIKVSTVLGCEIIPGLETGGSSLESPMGMAVFPKDPTQGLHDRIPPGRIQPCRVSVKPADPATCDCTMRMVSIQKFHPVQVEGE